MRRLIGRVYASDDRTTANYDAVNGQLTDEEARFGLILHYAGFDEDAGVFRIVNVWNRDAQGQAYLDDKVMPAVREVMGEDRGTAEPPRLVRTPPRGQAVALTVTGRQPPLCRNAETDSREPGHESRAPFTLLPRLPGFLDCVAKFRSSAHQRHKRHAYRPRLEIRLLGSRTLVWNPCVFDPAELEATGRAGSALGLRPGHRQLLAFGLRTFVTCRRRLDCGATVRTRCREIG